MSSDNAELDQLDVEIDLNAMLPREGEENVDWRDLDEFAELWIIREDQYEGLTNITEAPTAIGRRSIVPQTNLNSEVKGSAGETQQTERPTCQEIARLTSVAQTVSVATQTPGKPSTMEVSTQTADDAEFDQGASCLLKVPTTEAVIVRHQGSYSTSDSKDGRVVMVKGVKILVHPRLPGCYNCGGSGHSYGICKHPRKRFCFRCGLRGVTVKDCPVCAERWRQDGPYVPQLGRHVQRDVLELDEEVARISTAKF